jgi:hypothetical protein
MQIMLPRRGGKASADGGGCFGVKVTISLSSLAVGADQSGLRLAACHHLASVQRRHLSAEADLNPFSTRWADWDLKAQF